MHTKPDLRVFLKWMIAGSGSVITDVIQLGITHGMKARISLLSLLCIVSIAALAFALFNANRNIDGLEAKLATLETERLSLQKRIGTQAVEKRGQYSICFFSDLYSSSDELRWRIKVPEDGVYRLMYANDAAPGTGHPESGRQVKLNKADNHVLAVEFTESHLQMRTYSELDDGSRAGPRRATTLQGEIWLESLASTKRVITGMDSEPHYFNLDEPLKILELPGKRNTRFVIWIESERSTKR